MKGSVFDGPEPSFYDEQRAHEMRLDVACEEAEAGVGPGVTDCYACHDGWDRGGYACRTCLGTALVTCDDAAAHERERARQVAFVFEAGPNPFEAA